MLEFKAVKIRKPDELNVILGQSHFIKTAEDLYEALINVPGLCGVFRCLQGQT
jgi:adenosine/AMP kinase